MLEISCIGNKGGQSRHPWTTKNSCGLQIVFHLVCMVSPARSDSGAVHQWMTP